MSDLLQGRVGWAFEAVIQVLLTVLSTGSVDNERDPRAVGLEAMMSMTRSVQTSDN